MALASYKVGNGTLKLGPAGVQNISSQVTDCAVVPSEVVKTTEAVPTLDGSELPKEDLASIEWTLEGNVIQDIAAAAMVAYSWTNAGSTLAFEFIPNTVAARKVTGNLVMVPIKLGGTVKTTPQSDFKWRIVGTPVLAAAP